MNNIEQIIEKLRKVKTIANEGTEGERQAAEQLLSSLMKQYDISAEQLEDQKADYHMVYTGEGKYDYKLFKQIVFRFRSSSDVKFADLRKAKKSYIKLWSREGLGPANANAGVYCTKAELVELMSIFEIYRRDFSEHLQAFYYAYLDTNDLLVGEADAPLTEQEREMLRKAAAMALGIEKKELFKQIENE